MTYFQRYSNGDCAAVWAELVALGSSVRHADLFADAHSVAQATMERVAGNIDILVGRLGADGYEFGVYPDGTPSSASFGFVRPDASSRRHLEELENAAGPIPISLRTFWEVVGSVSLIGRSPRKDWPEYTDPLYIDSPLLGIDDCRDWEGNDGWCETESFLCTLAPDVFHKDRVSGGAPYGVRLPDPNADAVLRWEWHDVHFIQYLRIAILEWGGFPGLSPSNPARGGTSRPPDFLYELKRDLLKF
jgi:hypothetical protein